MDEMSEENIFWPNMCRVAMRENIDSHYLLDACDNGMVYGRRAFNGVQHQPIHTGFPISSSLAHSFWVAPPNAWHNAIGIPLLPLSNHLIQGKMSHFLFFLFYYSSVGDLTLVRVKDIS